jgi:predicted AAA+ superfamily ATPase
MQNVDETLTGRAGIVRMCGLSKRELNGADNITDKFIPIIDEIINRSAVLPPFDYNKTIEIIHTGSLPELYKNEHEPILWQNYYESYIKTYIEKDIRNIINIQDELAFMKFLNSVASRTGQELNLSAIAETCGKEVNTVKKWLSILEVSGLVYLLPPYYNNINKRTIKTPKLYMLDTGLVCYLVGWATAEQMVKGAMWGAIFETYVVGEIIKSYYNSGQTILPLYYYRDKERKKVDLIIDGGGIIYPVEIKTTTEPNKFMCNNFSVLNSISNKTVGAGAIICLCERPLPIKDNVWAFNVDLI